MSNNEMQSMYDETQQRVEAAYQGFRAVYTVMKPPPIAPKASGWFAWISPKHFAMLLGLIGSVIVSASHTVPVFTGKDSIDELQFDISMVIGLAAFVMIEIMSISLSYSHTESMANNDTVLRVNRYVKWGKWFVVFVMAVANIYYVLGSNGIPVPDIFRLVIFLSVGLSAPIIAFLTGDILAIDVMKHNAKNRRDMQTYEEALKQWADGLATSWASQKNRWGGGVNIQVSKPEIKQLETVSNSSKQSSEGQTLTQKAAMQYISEKAEEYKEIAKTVREQNPTANQKDIAAAIAEAMTGDERGYMTVIRAYKKLNIEME